jgi:hypothetical protein
VPIDEYEPVPVTIRLDVDAVNAEFTDVWRSKSVVLVEASDLVRASIYRSVASSDQRDVVFHARCGRPTDSSAGYSSRSTPRTTRLWSWVRPCR